MSSFEHHAIVDKGLKMKIKRKNVNVDKTEKPKKDSTTTNCNNKSDSNSKGDNNINTKPCSEVSSQSTNGMLGEKSAKLSLFSDREKSPKSKTLVTKKEKSKAALSTTKFDPPSGSSQACSSFNGGIENLFGGSTVAMEPKLGETATGKKDCVPDPYEFNAKVEDDISMPIKKMKIDKEKPAEAMSSSLNSSLSLSSASSSISSASTSQSQDATTDTADASVVTDPDCLGPCEPGTQVTLGGIVWHESENGVLVVNVTWRGKTYVGTLLDATRHDWAPPRFNCESPSLEMDSRTPKGRGKRRGAANTPVNDTRTLRKGRRGSNVQTFTAPPSPAKSESSVGGVKRKGRPQDIDLSVAEQRSSKRSRSGSQVPTPNSETPPTDAQGYIECPEPNCSKKYRHANGLKYHQSHAHSGTNFSMDDSKDDMDCEDIPLSVMKNSAKREKEVKKEASAAHAKDSKRDKDSSDSKKHDKANHEVTSAKKAEKEESTSDTNNSKDSAHKNDAKCDNHSANSSTSKGNKKESSSIKSSIAHTNNNTSSSSSGKVHTSVSSKSNGNNGHNSSSSSSQLSVSSQSNASSVQSLPSQASSSSGIVTSSLTMTSSVTSSSSAIQYTTQGDNSKADVMNNKLVDIKPKITNENSTQRVAKANRPIVPAPPHTVLSSVQVTHSNLSPVMSHTQMSPQLKPIQPKPTIMGEPQNINPALADLNKDRKKVQKKKTKDNVSSGSNSGQKSDQPTIKIERTGVIKTNPMPNSKGPSDQSKKDSSSAKDMNRSGHVSDNHRSHSLNPHGHKAADLSHSRPNQNTNLLKVGSPLQVNTPDKGPVSDDVQSPAYSDISDANESASPAAPSETSPQKQKEESMSSKKKDKTEQPPVAPPSTEGQMPPQYGMYYYGGQGQYPGMNNMSPGQKGQGPQSNAQNHAQNTHLENGKSAPTPNKEKASESEEAGPVKIEKKTEVDSRDPAAIRPKGLPPGMHPGMPPHMVGPPPPNMSPHQVQEYQMMLQQVYMQSQHAQHAQYQQYMHNGWYQGPSMDPGYMRQMMEEQRRMQAVGGEGPPGLGGPPKGYDARDLSRGSGPDGVKGPQGQGPHGQPGVTGRKDEGHGPNVPRSLISPGQSSTGSGSDRNDSGKKSGDEKSMKDQALRDKQSENHQILKENIELKNEMRGQEYGERMRQTEEMRRYKMYQEQKQIEERKKAELARKGDGRVENLSTKAPSTKPIVEHSARNLTSVQHRGAGDMAGSKDVVVKRENNNSGESKMKDSRGDSMSRDSSSSRSDRLTDDKSKITHPDKHRSETPTRNPDGPKPRPSGSSSKSGSPCSIPPGIPGSPSYNPYVTNYPYMQNSHFQGMDSTLPMYRNHTVNPALMIQGSPYIHPSQMGYRSSSDTEDKDKSSAQKSAPSSSDSDLKKASDSNSSVVQPYYGNMHKIHELSEKGRPKSRNSSPGPVKPTDPATSVFDKHRDYTNSPPTQRHVHTHHHTHVLQPGPGLQPGAPIQGHPHPPGYYDPYSGEYAMPR